MPKQYKIQEKTFTLGKPTPKRLKLYCGVLGIDNFSDISSELKVAELNTRILDIALDEKKLQKLFEAIFEESDFSGIEWGDIDMTAVDEAFNDFFSQRLRTSTRPLK